MYQQIPQKVSFFYGGTDNSGQKNNFLAPSSVVAESGRLNFKLDSPHIVQNWVNFVTVPTSATTLPIFLRTT